MSVNEQTAERSTPAERIAGRSVLVFDNSCVMCSQFSRFFMFFDRRHRVFMASLQGENGGYIARTWAPGVDTILFYHNEKVYQKSSAVLRALFYIKPWLFAPGMVFLLIPRFIRDGIYDFIARHRYKVFGQKEVCIIPTPEQRSFFLD